MKPLLIGYMPSKEDAYAPLSGVIGRRLLSWARLKVDETLRDPINAYFETINLNLHYNQVFDSQEAEETVARIYQTRVPSPWILCGRVVASYFGRGRKQPYWVWKSGACVIPHPSGRSRVYNDPKARAKTASILKYALKSSFQPVA